MLNSLTVWDDGKLGKTGIVGGCLEWNTTDWKQKTIFSKHRNKLLGKDINFLKSNHNSFQHIKNKNDDLKAPWGGFSFFPECDFFPGICKVWGIFNLTERYVLSMA